VKPARYKKSTLLGLPKTQAALAYATRVYRGQRRKADGAPFIAHPREMASVLYYAGAPDHVIAAGAPHDTIEKTDTDATEFASAPNPGRRPRGCRKCG
jgi:(p)ppGpp synthase/HD superfamily hydrolase